jgi:predicted dehydrogenase
MTNPLRFGILGTGNIARQFADGVIASSRRAGIVAAGSRSLGSAQAFAQPRGIGSAHGSYDSLLEDPGVDAVYNSLPNHLHHEWTIKAMQAGKHVLCEKPFAMNRAQAQEMFDVARRTGRVLIEAFMYRSHPLTRAVVGAVRAGEIGEIKLIRASFCYQTRRVDGNVRFQRQLGGGALMDIGCYCINFARLIAADEPAEIHAAAHFHESGVDDLVVATMKFPSGICASITCGMTVQADNTASICGTDGYMEIPIPWKPPAQQAAYVIARSTPPKMDLAQGARPPEPKQTRFVNGGQELYALEADDFARTVLDGQSPALTEADTLGNMSVLDRIRSQIGLTF